MRALMTASVPSMIGQFNMDNINILQSLGYKVDVACNFKDDSIWNVEKINQLKIQLNNLGVSLFQIDFERNINKLCKHVKAYKQISKLIKQRNYEIIHTHTPISSFITRIAFKNSSCLNSTRMIYTAHGFHFFKGAPKMNWILYYPIERWLANYTDTLITINTEDFELAKKKFRIQNIYKVNGVGIKYNAIISAKPISIKTEFSFNENDFIVFSVGELNTRKNHLTVIKAIKNLNNPHIKYIIAGKGNEKASLEKVIAEYELQNQVYLLGHRNDVFNIYKACDLFAFPSKREGLGLAAIEAMAAGLPIITSNINGINEYSINRVTGLSYNPNDVEGFSTGIKYFADHPVDSKKIGEGNILRAKKFDIQSINEEMKKIYSKKEQNFAKTEFFII